MLNLLIDFLFYALLGVFLYSIMYQRIIMMYYRYIYYRLQGIPCVGFPWPVIGNLPKFMRALKNMHQFSKTPLEEYFSEVFGPPGSPTPPIFMDFRNPHGTLVITDPHYVSELYITKNKFFDKAEKEKRVYQFWFG